MGGGVWAGGFAAHTSFFLIPLPTLRSGVVRELGGGAISRWTPRRSNILCWGETSFALGRKIFRSQLSGKNFCTVT
jgi:hypothetical protein